MIVRSDERWNRCERLLHNYCVCYLNGMTLSASDILGPGGRIAARLANYEHRPQQLAMADAVARAIREKKHLVVEAGTGVGKSFAYLVPAILAATELQGVAAGGPVAAATEPPVTTADGAHCPAVV